MTARTLALVREIPVHGVCSLDILAAEAMDDGLEEFVVATDARRKEVYLASYAGGGGSRARGAQAGGRRDRRLRGRSGWVALPGPRSRTSPDRSTRRPRCSATSCCVGASRSLGPDPLYLRRPDAAEPGKPKRVS